MKDKIIFTDTSKEKEWEELDPKIKKMVMYNLSSTCDRLENKVAIEMLCHVINDLIGRIETLENK